MKRAAGISALNLALAIGLGAFGAHGLKSRISDAAMEWFKTGHNYHMWVGLALLGVGLAIPHWKGLRGWMTLMLVGTLLFSGSLYLMSVTGMRWLGAITPLGGASWIGGMVWLGVYLLRKEASQ